MGLLLYSTGYPGRWSYCYSTYYNVRCAIIRKVYGEELLEIFKSHISTKEETDTWNRRCNDDLDLLLLHSDCDGKLSWQDCKKVYDQLKDVELDGPDYSITIEAYNGLRDILRYCWKTRHVLFYY